MMRKFLQRVFFGTLVATLLGLFSSVSSPAAPQAPGAQPDAQAEKTAVPDVHIMTRSYFKTLRKVIMKQAI